MATIRETGGLAAANLRERVEELAAALDDDAADLSEVARLADAVGGTAGMIRDLYTEVEQTLERGMREYPGAGEERGGTQPQASEEDDEPADDATKRELLEQARELDVEGRSSMSKEELSEAIEAEENVTKDELLERAREAGIEGRSSMTKDDLRKALQEAKS